MRITYNCSFCNIVVIILKTIETIRENKSMYLGSFLVIAKQQRQQQQHRQKQQFSFFAQTGSLSVHQSINSDNYDFVINLSTNHNIFNLGSSKAHSFDVHDVIYTTSYMIMSIDVSSSTIASKIISCKRFQAS